MAGSVAGVSGPKAPLMTTRSISVPWDREVMDRMPHASNSQLLLAAGECQSLKEWFPGSIMEALAQRWLDAVEAEFERRRVRLAEFRARRGG